MAVTDISHLPLEVLERIFLCLGPLDLLSVVGVSPRWREAGKGTRLWAWSLLRQSCLPRLININLLVALKEIELEVGTVVSMLGLRQLEVHSTSLFSVGPSTLTATTRCMESVDLRYNQLGPRQATNLCSSLVTNTQLRCLNLTGNDLSSVEQGVLSLAVRRVEEVTLASCRLTTVQVRAIFTSLEETSNLKMLDLTDNILNKLDAELLVRVTSGLEEAIFMDCRLSSQQVTELCGQLEHMSRLKLLNLLDNARTCVRAGLAQHLTDWRLLHNMNIREMTNFT